MLFNNSFNLVNFQTIRLFQTLLTSVLCVYIFHQIVINNNVDYKISDLDTRDRTKKEITIVRIIVRFV